MRAHTYVLRPAYTSSLAGESPKGLITIYEYSVGQTPPLLLLFRLLGLYAKRELGRRRRTRCHTARGHTTRYYRPSLWQSSETGLINSRGSETFVNAGLR